MTTGAVLACERHTQIDLRTEITADAVNPVRTFRLAVINLQKQVNLMDELK